MYKSDFIPELNVLEEELEIARKYYPHGHLVDLKGIKKSTIKKVFGYLPEDIGIGYSYEIPFTYKGQFFSLYYRNRKPRLGAGNYKLGQELVKLINKVQNDARGI